MDKAHSSIMTELQQLVDIEVSTPVMAWKLDLKELKKDILTKAVYVLEGEFYF